MSDTPQKSSLAQAAVAAWQDGLFLSLLAGSGAVRLSLTLALWVVVSIWGSHEALHVLAHHLRSLDALSYQLEAQAILSYWRDHTAGAPAQVLGFSMLVALLYKVVFPHPLLISILSIACYLGVGILAYQISSLMGNSRRHAIFVSILAASWPSSLAWSVTPLKEGPVLLTIFAALYCFMRMLCGRPMGKKSWLACLFFFAASALSLEYLRHYFWYLLWGLLPLAIFSRWPFKARIEKRPSWLAAGLVAAVLAAVLLASTPLGRDGLVKLNKTPQQSVSRSWQLALPAHAGQAAPPKYTSQEAPPEESFFIRWLKKISAARRNFAKASGASLSPEAQQGVDSVVLTYSFNDWRSAVNTIFIMIKAGLRDLFLFPYPWQRWPESPGWGPLQLAVSAQILLWYFLMPGIAAGAVIRIRRYPLSTATLFFWGVGVGMVLSMIVLNRGTLFRLRDMALLPLLLIWHPWPYLKLWRLFGGRG